MMSAFMMRSTGNQKVVDLSQRRKTEVPEHTQSAEAYVNSEYAVALTELEV